MRKKLLIGLALYLALGVVFGLVTDRENYMCPALNHGGGDYSALPDEGITLVEMEPICFPISSTADRLQWVATTAPGWLALVIRNLVQGGPIQIGNIYLGNAI
jgi:hypothetical protein